MILFLANGTTKHSSDIMATGTTERESESLVWTCVILWEMRASSSSHGRGECTSPTNH